MKTASILLALAVAVVTVGASIVPASALSIKGPINAGHQKPVKSTYECGGDLGYLRRVYEEEVAGVIDASIVPICESDDYGLMRSEGNAGAIRQEIADNGDIMDALDLANFRVDDVVAVRMTGEDSAIIYVHTFLYR